MEFVYITVLFFCGLAAIAYLLEDPQINLSKQTIEI